ncbi:MAG: CoA-binding protein [Gammaproteobacteria bacterium]|nr:CoA-binding protein [Gammaproteobacteria bacterium]
MPSDRETFWHANSYAVIGDSQQKPFPVLTYGALKARGSTVYAVDESAAQIEGDPVYRALEALPGPVDAAVLEVAREDTAGWIERVADAGISNVWIHMGRDTPEALELARQRGLDVRHGTCAVMYLTGGYHKIHKWIEQLRGQY